MKHMQSKKTHRRHLEQRRLIPQFVPPTWIRYALIFLIALFVRWAWIILCPTLAPTFADPLRGDAADYDALARSITAGQGFGIQGEPTAFRAPGYPFFLAGVYWVFGASIPIAQFVQAVLSAFTATLIAYLGKRIVGGNVGWFAGIGAALYYYFIYATAWLVSETLFLFFWVIGLIQLILFIQEKQPSRIVLSGIVLGLATLVRPVTLLAVFIWSGLGMACLKPIRVWFMLGLVTLATILPWTVRNWIVFHAFIPISTNSGYVFYGANNSEAIGGQREGFPPWLPHLSEPARDRIYIQNGLAWIAEHPDRFLILLPQKLARLWSPLSISSADKPLATPFDVVIYPLWIMFLILSGLGCVLIFRRNAQVALVLVAPIVAACLTALIFFGSTRYAMPMIPSLLIFTASAIDWCVLSVREYVSKK